MKDYGEEKPANFMRHNLLADALIAATAVTYDIPIWTTNKKDFQHTEGIHFINP